MLDWQLTEDYGSLPPPSSPLDTKASTKSPFQLITNYINSQRTISAQIFQRSQEFFIFRSNTRNAKDIVQIQLVRLRQFYSFRATKNLGYAGQSSLFSITKS